MKILFKILALSFIILSANTVHAQTRQKVFDNINKLIKKAAGQKSDVSFAGNRTIIIKSQLFTGDTYTFISKTDGDDFNWVKRASKINWDKLNDHTIFGNYKNEKTCIIKLSFKSSYVSELYPDDAPAGDDDPSDYETLEFYCLATDQAKMEEQLKLLETFIPKKAESPFNAQIRKFTKQETLNWITEKLVANIEGDQYTNNLKLVSINTCTIVFSYGSIVGRKYEVTLPTAIESINKHGIFTYSAAICKTKYFPYGMIQPEEEIKYSKYAFLSLPANKEELIDNMACAFKHMNSFCK